MLKQKTIAAVVFGLLAGAQVNVWASQDVQEYQIMSEAEAEQHRQKMASLSGVERNAYRDAEYTKLRERAASEGYAMPETTPWSATSAPAPEASAAPAVVAPAAEAAPVAAATDSTKVDADAAVDTAASSDTQADLGVTLSGKVESNAEAQASGQTENETMAEYRNTLRQRFDSFMEERKQRQAEEAKVRDQQQALLARQNATMLEQHKRLQQVQPYYNAQGQAVPPGPAYFPAYRAAPYWAPQQQPQR